MPLLDVRDLSVRFKTDDGIVEATDQVSLTVDRGKVLGIVGESGCGKSVTSLAMMRLLSRSSATVTGEVLLDGKDVLKYSGDEMRRIRGSEMAMIFQDPMTSLNPVYTIGWQLVEAVRLHGDASKDVASRRGIEMLKAVGIPSPEERMRSYPHELSGGMRQRVMIAMALINNPKLLIADEPTTALDVTTQAQILELVRRLRTDFDSSIIMITHDLGVIAELCDEVIVMYAGRVVERAGVMDLFTRPQHPYTWGLMASLPGRHTADQRLSTIPGSPPSLLRPPPGCRFAPRCPYVMNHCPQEPPPPLAEVPGRSQLVACHLDDRRRAEIGGEIAAAGHAAEVAR
jgi:oligopeptide/dipeptide ABC transporter ATP-binding protein